jgi:hypothetical protein
MAIKAYLFTNPDCHERCDEARKVLKQYLDNGEVEEMDISEALRKFRLGEPGGTPFVGVIAESTGECISQSYFQRPPEEDYADLQAEVEAEIDSERAVKQ